MTLRGVIVSFIMTIVLSIMVLGYAALQQRIDIQGEATVDSTYRVEITRVQEGTVVGDARSTVAPQYNGLNASFYVGLTNTTDLITYNIEITNYSTVDIKLNELSITVDGSNYIKSSKLGISNGDIMLAGSTKTITLKVKYNGEAQSSEQTGTVTLNFNFTRLKGGTGQVVPEVYDAYEIGDKVTFAGSDWYVIEDSNQNQDYVVLLKERVLTNSELGEYANNGTSAMAYYYSDTCHLAGSYGYSESVRTECNGYSDYSQSKIKEAVDAYMDSKNISNSLKEVDGYKIRLIKLDELQSNLGYGNSTDLYDSVPNWVYGNNIGNYWTMTSNGVKAVYYVYRLGQIRNYGIDNTSSAVRPVINLYKDAIE